MESIVINGKIRSQSIINRGNIITYSEEIWKKRYLKYLINKVKGIMLIILLILILFNIILYLELNDLFIFILYFIIIIMPFIIAILLILYHVHNSITPGLYENGVQYFSHVFIPNREIIGFEPDKNGKYRIILTQSNECDDLGEPLYLIISEKFLGHAGILKFNEIVLHEFDNQ